ncbi:aspartate aminotransferase family protein [Sphaerobacter thermophilus]|uniref:Glutamate-1-semialdehyde 2,1-aminomutase n=1 Tax=Sphaerobacter thermophilus (strain ATCC 49802 / DSM 20745 / KCCM 41009 / NCIMB 13125 / S 6022) TaxID=479434 RepID=D1C4S6_SPHTD|nr:aspartate aminotransferase family protein [Sphaerobacter thermophilus]ACZ39243.1 aminotransferase class-III [Sphaerobacter thermophilus DSM 20745]
MQAEGRFTLDKSRAMFERIAKSIAGGESSYARLKKGLELCFDRGQGSRFWDVDGHEYIDYSLGYGPLIFGHNPPEVTAAVVEAITTRGSVATFPYDLDYEVGEQLVQMVPGVDQVRFANSGTEATMAAARLARAYTGRTKIVQMEGGYHGFSDTHYWSIHPDVYSDNPAPYSPEPRPSSRGIPPSYGEALLIAQYNDRENMEMLFDRYGDDIAAVLVEPIQANSGLIPPEPGYLEFLRDITRQHGALLIFDEVITGFRVAPGGAQELYGVIPDITTMAKALGGGFPIAAFGGSEEVMGLEARNEVMHGGTYTANLVALAAANVVLRIMRERREELWDRLNTYGARLCQGIGDACREAGLRNIVQGVGPIWHIFFAKPGAPDLDRIRNYRDALAYSSVEIFDRFHDQMLRRGVYFHPYHLERWFLSTAHDERDVQETLEAAAEAAEAVAAELRAEGKL